MKTADKHNSVYVGYNLPLMHNVLHRNLNDTKKYFDKKKEQERKAKEESDKINKKMWFIKKDVFKPAYESYVNQARRVSERLIPKLLVHGKKLWRTDLQYFLDKR